MYYLKLIFKNIFRHRLRSLLTMVGLVVAILAFGLLQTVVHAWYAGADMASANRLITRNATSLVFSLPAYYRERIRAIDGVTAVAISNWFGGIYKDQSFSNFFATFGVDHDNFFDLYPEFKVKPDELLAFITDPTIIVADEPTGDLDRKSAEEVLGLLRRLNGEMGKTIIMVSHDGHAVQSARHVTHLEKGELLPA